MPAQDRDVLKILDDVEHLKTSILEAMDAGQDLGAPFYRLLADLEKPQIKAMCRAKISLLRRVSKIAPHLGNNYVYKRDALMLDAKTKIAKDTKVVLSKAVCIAYTARYLNPISMKVEHARFEGDLVDLIDAPRVGQVQQPGMALALVNRIAGAIWV